MTPQEAAEAVYPRWRGEHQKCSNPIQRRAGLSPLARGTRLQRIRQNPDARFIPAGAGNTRPATEESSMMAGLSPLARGTPDDNRLKNALVRFIPAGAGNTRRAAMLNGGKPVYPRWRGEHRENEFPTCFTTGLSPLARGTRN